MGFSKVLSTSRKLGKWSTGEVRPVSPFAFMLGKYVLGVKMNLILHKDVITASWKRWGYP